MCRASIRESLRIFKLAEVHLKCKGKSFESICLESHSPSQKFETHSCGQTIRCFASLFFSSKQNSGVNLSNIIDGHPFLVMLSNPNFSFYSFRTTGPKMTTRTKALYDRGASSISRFASSFFLSSFSSEMLSVDIENTLPRVLLCSLTWISIDGEMEEQQIQDHKFSLIKHDNSRFQIVQGYIASQLDDTCLGFGLCEWQESGHFYASADGFDKTKMTIFLKSMENFCTNDATFDSKNYASMFGVQPKVSEGKKYWPSFSFQEVTDDLIIGHGEKPIADALETTIRTCYTNYRNR
jgi:hypothetical protein